MPRATTAACDVAPPFAVRMPSAAIMPWTSSGVVSVRTRIVLRPSLLPRDRVVGREDDLPGGRARRSVEAFARDRELLVGIDARVKELIERLRVDHADGAALVDQPFVDEVERDLDRGLGAALRAARLQHEELAALDGELEILHVAIVALEPLGDLVELLHRPAAAARARSAIFSGVRMPATTSSPCALVRYSPKSARSPVLGLRVNATPVPESSPMLPKTISITLTAVPQSSGILLKRR